MLRSSLSIVAFVSAPHVSIVAVALTIQAVNLEQYCFFLPQHFSRILFFSVKLYFSPLFQVHFVNLMRNFTIDFLIQKLQNEFNPSTVSIICLNIPAKNVQYSKWCCWFLLKRKMMPNFSELVRRLDVYFCRMTKNSLFFSSVYASASATHTYTAYKQKMHSHCLLH